MNTLKQRTEITKHQAVLLEMLKDIDAVCKRNDISYQLFAGTALGAVRHHGFIPWDDDVDIIMTRTEYERFLTAAAAELDSEVYYIQQEDSEHWPMPYSKLRLNNTTCLEKFHAKDPLMHQGVYVDIFPCDNLSDCFLMRIVQFVSSKIIIAKALDARGYETKSIVKKAFMKLCRLIPAKRPKALCLRRKDTGSRMVHSFFAAGKRYGKNIFPRAWMEQTVDMQFEDARFPVCAYYDQLLTLLYGDYHTLPSVEQRKCKQHVAVLDLEQPYTVHLSEHSDTQFDTLTQSIR